MTRYDQHGIERRKWESWAFIGEHGGALLTKDSVENELTVTEIHVACAVTVLLARMVRVGRYRWRMRQ